MIDAFLEWIKDPPDGFYSGAFGAIFGGFVSAVAGGIIAWFSQRAASKTRRRERIEAQAEEDRRVALLLLLRHRMIVDDLLQLTEHVKEAHRLADDEGELWECLRPVANLPDVKTFTVEEQSLLSKLGQHHSLEDVIVSQRIQKTTIDLFRLFEQKKIKILEMPPERANGRFAPPKELTGAAAKGYSGLLDEIAQIAQTISDHLERNLSAVQKTNLGLHDMMAEHFDLKISYQVDTGSPK